MREEFEKLAAAGKVSRQQIEPLVQLSENGYVYHRSWGVGKIASWDWLFSKMVIDFQGRPAQGIVVMLNSARNDTAALSTMREGTELDVERATQVCRARADTASWSRRTCVSL